MFFLRLCIDFRYTMPPCRLVLLGLALGACAAEELPSLGAVAGSEKASSFLQTGHGRGIISAVAGAASAMFGEKKLKPIAQEFVDAVPKDLYGPWAHHGDVLKVRFTARTCARRKSAFTLVPSTSLILRPRSLPHVPPFCVTRISSLASGRCKPHPRPCKACLTLGLRWVVKRRCTKLLRCSETDRL